jgi:hypothetical protein
MIPIRERRSACYDPERRCAWHKCGASIPRDRQENALRCGRYPKYCSDKCSRRAWTATWYATRGAQMRKSKWWLSHLRAKRRKKRREARAAD